MTDPSTRPGQPVSRRLSPEQVRNARFNQARGRRGLAEGEVVAFTHRLAEELGARESEIATLVDENGRLKSALRDWQHEQATVRDSYAREWASSQAVTLMAKAQQQIDAKIADTELYCRNREQQANQHYEEILRQAQRNAKEESERVAWEYRASSGPSYSPEQERARRQQVYITALLRSLDALRAHVDATREAFVGEIESLASDNRPGGSLAVTGQPPEAIPNTTADGGA